jgi:hypothetical protein
MKSFILYVVTFLIISILGSLVVTYSLPLLSSWHLSECKEPGPLVCAISDLTLSYWWLAFLPIVLLATFVVKKVIFNKKHAKV